MAELLIELFSEEIPAGLQMRAAGDLARLVGEQLKKAGIEFETPQTYATPRRLVVVMDGLPKSSPDVREEKKGPRVGAPEQALQGFLRGAGFASIDEAEIQSDPKKGDFYVAVIESKGRKTADLIAEIMPDVIRNFPWPKSMRWGAGRLKWVRPLHSMICILDGKVVKFEVDGIASGNKSRGHRFMGDDSFKVESFKEYKKALKARKVVLDGADRAEMIARDARKIAAKAGFELVEDEGLLREVAGLVEWPIVLMGTFDEAFLDVPDEVLTTTMKKHQKCFSVADAKTGKLVNRFMLVANLKAKDGGKAIIAGNERVIRARLSDAKFFWDNDRKHKLEDLTAQLSEVRFHEKLGTQLERVERIKALAVELAPIVGADKKKVERAAELCKADLLSEIVGEFPDLQGLMGRYIALEQGEDKAVAAAIEDHYKPLGPTDSVPSDPVSIAVALADKLDMLIGFWAIDEKPTGSKDPFALRRSALGIIRIVRENKITLCPRGRYFQYMQLFHPQIDETKWRDAADHFQHFFDERIKVQLRESGARHDLVDAVLRLHSGQTDILTVIKRVAALERFLDTDNGRNLLVGIKRAANILRIEEKKDGRSYGGAVDLDFLSEQQEKALWKEITKMRTVVDKALKAGKFDDAMTALAKLRGPVDDFFDHVTVNADDAMVRENRLKLLDEIVESARQVADFSKVDG